MAVQIRLNERLDHIDGYGQVCCPTPTHGQTLFQLSAPTGSLCMVDTALNDHGNLTSDMCDDMQTPMMEDKAPANAHDVQSPTTLTQDAQPLTQEVQQEEAARVALRACARHDARDASTCPKLQTPLAGMEIYNSHDSDESDSSKEETSHGRFPVSDRSAPTAHRP